jgi:tetratricopeptide (TPR) repeat protein
MTERDTLRQQAHEACLQEDYVTAYALYEELLQVYPEDAEILLDYGRAVYREYADLDKAACLFEQALEREPDSVELLLWLADIGATGYGPGYKAAVNLYQRVIELDPCNVDAYVGLGLQYHAPSVSMTSEEATQAFRKATQLDAQRADAHLDLGMLLLDTTDTPAARKEFLVTVNLLNTTGKKKLAKSVQQLIDQIERQEPIKNRFRLNLSSRYLWLSQEQ